MPFEKVRPTKVSTIAASQIVEASIYGSLPVGSNLFSNLDLATHLELDRLWLRETLPVLQAARPFESKPIHQSCVKAVIYHTAINCKTSLPVPATEWGEAAQTFHNTSLLEPSSEQSTRKGGGKWSTLTARKTILA